MANIDKALPIGTVLQGEQTYRIERVLGSGGFGITYLASTTIQFRNISVPATVAIKEHFMGSQCERGSDTTSVVCPGTHDSRVMVANSLKDFISEARRLAGYGANHPNIVKVNEIFEANGTAYYVMEYLEGKSLADYIRENGPLDEEAIRTLVLPVVDATAYLHRNRLTHLDIKPGNIMLTGDDKSGIRPVLIDFGLSKHYNEDGSATSTVNTQAYSDGYSPTEQYSGIRTFSPTADVYALGATLYDAALGRRPAISTEWPVGEPAATIARLPLNEPLRSAMTRAMAARKDERFPDAGAMLAAINSGGGGAYVPPIPPQNPVNMAPQRPQRVVQPVPEAPVYDEAPRSRKPLIIGIVAFILVAAAVFAGIKFAGSGSAEQGSGMDTIAVVDVDNMQEVAATPNLMEGKLTPEQVAELERQRHEAAEAAERERQRQQALEQERQQQEAQSAQLERDRQRQEEIDRQRREEAERERQRREEAERERQRQEDERNRLEANHQLPHNLDLAVRRNGQTLYLPQTSWQSLIHSGDTKLGVVIIKDGQRFILSLSMTADLNWDNAMSRFGSSLPTKSQAEAIARQHTAVNNALRAYGATMPTDWHVFWTRTENDAETAWGLDMSGGYTGTGSKPAQNMVRTVSPL